MIHFIAGALVGLVLANLGANLVRGARAALGRWVNAPAAFADIARREATARRAGLALALALFLAVTLLLYLALWHEPPHGAAPGALDRAALALQADLAALERRLLTARGFRALLGFAFGLGLAELLHRWSAASAARAGGPGPWWTSPAAALPAALLLLAAFALVAPRGELNMAFLQRVKTPFGEAEFARDERQVRLELVSEPQGVFRLDRRGLGDAIDIARADLQLLEATRPDAPETAQARAALGFLVSVLQPIALCVQQIDALYGDQQLLTDNLSLMGANLARALVLAREPTARTGDARDAVMTGPWSLALSRQRQLPALDATSGPGRDYVANLCAFGGAAPLGDPFAALRAQDDADLRAILGHPSALHAASMFFLWSGNPRAAEAMLAGADSALRKAEPDCAGLGAHPGLWLEAGFVDRWISRGESDAGASIAKLVCAVRAASDRLATLRRAAGPALAACPADPPAAIYAAGSADTRPAFDGAAPACEAGACAAQLAYGFFAHLERRLRNHVVFETALAALAATDVETARDLLDRHRAEAAALEAAASRPASTCFPDQRAAMAAGAPGATLPVTPGESATESALHLDSVGLFRLAEGMRWNDPDRIEAAVALLDRAMEAGGARLGAPLSRTIALHRRQALAELGAVID